MSLEVELDAVASLTEINEKPFELLNQLSAVQDHI